MGTDFIVCSRCRNAVPRGSRYCPRCGEPLDPELVTQLQSLYTRLRVFDAVIESGDGARSVADLRAAYLREYLELRRGPAVAAPVTTPLTSTTPAAGTPPTPAASPQAAPAPVAATTALSAAPPAAVEEGPIFSWQHFVAEQAIAIMAYLGGFLLLVATLAFVVGAWQALPDRVKFVAVVIVYIIFGVLGFTFRNAQRLRAVGRVYLGVFALMTPLVALALYRFELQHIASFPLSAVICLSAAYAAIVYLALAWTTRFATYAYLGWTSLGIAGLALVPWLNAPTEWTYFALGVIGLVLLVPNQLRHSGRAEGFVAVAGTPALQLSVLASSIAAIGATISNVTIWIAGPAAPSGTVPLAAAAAAGACILVPLALGWSFTLRSLDGATRRLDPLLVDAVDWLVGAFAAQAVVSIATWAQAPSQATAVTLSVVALAELGGAVIFRSAPRERRNLRRALLVLAFALGCIGVSIVRGDSSPNWSLIAALSATLVVVVGATLIEDLPWLLLLAGFFLTWTYNTLVAAVFVSAPTSEWLSLPTLEMFLTLAVWCAGLVLSRGPSTRRFASWVYLVALGDAVFVTTLLQGHSAVYQTAILLALTVIAFVAARLEHQRLIGGLTVGFFGILAVLPFVLESTEARNGWIIAGVVLLPGVVALIVRRIFGRDWSYAPYTIALLAAAMGGLALSLHPPANVLNLTALGIPFASWALAGAFAIGMAVALWERQPWLTIVPAVFACWAILLIADPVASFVLVLALAAAGAGLRLLRGPWWNVALVGAAALASLSAVAALAHLDGDTRNWQVAEWLVFAVVAYLLCFQEQQPIATIISVAYVLPALLFLPGPDNLVPTLIITFGSAGIGVAIGRLLGRRWALALYAIAIEGSIIAVVRVPSSPPGSREALLLIFAVVAYAIAVLERQPWAGLAATLYAIWAVVLQPDAHALLPLALAFAVLGLVTSRTLGARWSWPAYLSAVVATMFTAVTGMHHPEFEAGALAALAVAAYIVVAVESRADALPLPFILGALALAATYSAVGWEIWQGILSFAALGWLYFSGSWLWPVIPAVRDRGPMWWANLTNDLPDAASWRDMRHVGIELHQWSGLLVGAGAVIVSLFVPHSFSPKTTETETVVLVLLSLAGMLGVQGRSTRRRIAWYVAGELVALAVTFQARWLGADNLQAFILAPASYQIVIGALLPHDERLRKPVRAGQAFTLIGSLLLLLPTLGQTFAQDPNWIYALALSIEALVIVGVGVGIRSRLLVLTGSVFIGAAALRGAALAVNSGVPSALFIAALAILLLAGATWLSLRARR